MTADVRVATFYELTGILSAAAAGAVGGLADVPIAGRVGETLVASSPAGSVWPTPGLVFRGGGTYAKLVLLRKDIWQARGLCFIFPTGRFSTSAVSQGSREFVRAGRKHKKGTKNVLRHS